ncbi:MAG: hypothetical protein KGL39_56205, partial [Patescibacteria group bacterium]|nr:hypothetical protein [Patescibacteria group bacterium]
WRIIVPAMFMVVDILRINFSPHHWSVAFGSIMLPFWTVFLVLGIQKAHNDKLRHGREKE